MSSSVKAVADKAPHEARVKAVADKLRNYPDFPKKGVLFRDIFPLTKDPSIFEDLINLLTEHIQENFTNVDAVVGLESRGFIFGPLIALKLNTAFVPVRKKGKLPGKCVSVGYNLEYGKDAFEIQHDALKEGNRVLIIDDLLATGGTMDAAVRLMKEVKAEVLECMVVIELEDLKGKEKISEKCWSLIKFSGDDEK